MRPDASFSQNRMYTSTPAQLCRGQCPACASTLCACRSAPSELDYLLALYEHLHRVRAVSQDYTGVMNITREEIVHVATRCRSTSHRHGEISKRLESDGIGTDHSLARDADRNAQTAVSGGTCRLYNGWNMRRYWLGVSPVRRLNSRRKKDASS